jgi:hypothetical protein
MHITSWKNSSAVKRKNLWDPGLALELMKRNALLEFLG